MDLQYDRPGHAFGTVNGVTIEGFCLPVPPSNLIFITAPGVFLGCGFFDIRTFNKLGIAAVRITGVSTLEELLLGKITELTESAETSGVRVGMTGYDALLHFSASNPHL